MRLIIKMIKETIAYFWGSKDIGEGLPNKRAHIRLEGKNMTASVNGIECSVVNWGHGGVLLDASNCNIPLTDDDVDLTLKLMQDGEVMTLKHHGHFLRKDDKGVVVKLAPVDSISKTQINRMVDAALADSFISSQAA